MILSIFLISVCYHAFSAEAALDAAGAALEAAGAALEAAALEAAELDAPDAVPCTIATTPAQSARRQRPPTFTAALKMSP